MESETEILDAVKLFCKEVGVPKTMIVDPSLNNTCDKVRQFCHKIGTTLSVLEESTQYFERTELYIGLMKKLLGRDMHQLNSPMKVWCFTAKRRATITTLTANNLFHCNDRIHLCPLLEKWATYPTCPSLDGMSGCILDRRQQPSHIQGKRLVDILVQQRTRAIKYVSGFCSRMARLFRGELSGV